MYSVNCTFMLDVGMGYVSLDPYTLFECFLAWLSLHPVAFCYLRVYRVNFRKTCIYSGSCFIPPTCTSVLAHSAILPEVEDLWLRSWFTRTHHTRYTQSHSSAQRSDRHGWVVGEGNLRLLAAAPRQCQADIPSFCSRWCPSAAKDV